MEFGVCLPQYGRDVTLEDIQLVAQDAEDQGFRSLWASDHVVTPDHLHSRFGPIFLDVFVVLSHASALTRSVKLGTTVLVTPYRNPLVAAKMIASLDVLSGGRVVLGVGAGGAPDEFAALGVPESQRGARTDEYLAAMIELWTTEPSDFTGRFTQFEGVHFAPKPLQQPHPPIWVGGRSDAALRRAVRFGQAWHPTRMDLDALAERMARLKELSSEFGRPESPATTIHQSVAFEIGNVGTEGRRGSPSQVAEDMFEYAEMGVRSVVCNFRGESTDEVRRAMETFARQVMPGLESED